jgi:hypothetical protein
MPPQAGAWEGEGLQCRQDNPSTSHASGSGPSFSLWEKGFSRHADVCASLSADAGSPDFTKKGEERVPQVLQQLAS